MARPLDLHDATGTIVEVPGKGIMFAYGDTVPSDGDEGYATGALFLHTDGAVNTALYFNIGTNASANFDAIG